MATKQVAKKKTVRKVAPRVKKAVKTLQFFGKSTCSTCRKARKSLQKQGYHLNVRDLVKHRLTSTELQKLIGKRDHKDFLNPRSEIYRKKKMKENPPSRREAVGMMAMNPDLIRRPVVVAGGHVAIGYDDKGRIQF